MATHLSRRSAEREGGSTRRTQGWPPHKPFVAGARRSVTHVPRLHPRPVPESAAGFDGDAVAFSRLKINITFSRRLRICRIYLYFVVQCESVPCDGMKNVEENAVRLISIRLGALVASGLLLSSAARADLMPGYTIGAGSQLLTSNGGAGLTLFNDSAATGGTDVTGTGTSFYSVLLDGSGNWTIGDTVNVTGVALALVDAATFDGTFTFSIRQGAGGTGTSGTAGLSELGSATATYTSGGGSSAYYKNFDSPITFVADANSTSIVVNWVSTAQMRWKKEAAAGAGRLPQVNYGNGNFVGGDDSVRFSIAGSVIPEPSTLSLAAMAGVILCLTRRFRRRSRG